MGQTTNKRWKSLVVAVRLGVERAQIDAAWRKNKKEKRGVGEKTYDRDTRRSRNIQIREEYLNLSKEILR